MIDRTHGLSLTQQARTVGISRGSVYYLPRPVSAADLALMRRIDQLHLDYPFAGTRMLRDLLALAGIPVGRKHVATLMRRMGIEAIYRKPNTSRRHPKHPIYPYLLRQLKMDRPNQVWAMDITYIPMAKGFVYLAAVIDWHSRRVLAWRVSISMETSFCIDAVEEALHRYGKPEIFNTDQGSQGVFNRSSQHRGVASSLCIRSRSQPVFSSPGFCAVCCSRSGQRPESPARSSETGQCLWGSIGVAVRSYSRWSRAAMGYVD